MIALRLRLRAAIVSWGLAGVLAGFAVVVLRAADAAPAGVAPAAAVAAAPAAPAEGTPAATQAAYLGPDMVLLNQLANLYEPVPFDHKTHAKMAQMWDGCVVCHHRPPPLPAATGTGTPPAPPPPPPPAPPAAEHDTDIPACRSCHPIDPATADIRMPALKGAYHRQCLNCHKEWMHENACEVCHRPRQADAAKAVVPTRDDILGRMHPPLPEPETHLYKMRYTPADGGNVLFRHKEHTVTFGLRCTVCHRRDNCSHCHDPQGDKTAQKPLQPGWTWAASHGPCMGCHQQDRCRSCHYKDGMEPPPEFSHVARSGQELDPAHEKLACAQCHGQAQTPPTCGDSACHKNGDVTFPAKRPGPYTPLPTAEDVPAAQAPAK